MKKIMAIVALVLIAIAFIVVIAFAETTRERFKARAIANKVQNAL